MVKLSKRVQEATEQLAAARRVMDSERGKEFAKLQELTTRLERDRLVWETSVVQCLVLGLSRRTIAAAAGVSHQTVANIAQRQLGDAYPTAGHFET